MLFIKSILGGCNSQMYLFRKNYTVTVFNLVIFDVNSKKTSV